MGLGNRIFGALLSLGTGILSYKLFEFWWNIYTKVYSRITPLQHDLAGISFILGLIVGFFMLIFAYLTVSD